MLASTLVLHNCRSRSTAHWSYLMGRNRVARHHDTTTERNRGLHGPDDEGAEQQAGKAADGNIPRVRPPVEKEPSLTERAAAYSPKSVCQRCPDGRLQTLKRQQFATPGRHGFENSHSPVHTQYSVCLGSVNTIRCALVGSTPPAVVAQFFRKKVRKRICPPERQIGADCV
jgi:hypothetical protein